MHLKNQSIALQINFVMQDSLDGIYFLLNLDLKNWSTQVFFKKICESFWHDVLNWIETSALQ
jgi:hypothetical protein